MLVLGNQLGQLSAFLEQKMNHHHLRRLEPVEEGGNGWLDVYPLIIHEGEGRDEEEERIPDVYSSRQFFSRPFYYDHDTRLYTFASLDF
eukprot:Trichotokara_eunicae@DN4996_c0_g1_i2.p1